LAPQMFLSHGIWLTSTAEKKNVNSSWSVKVASCGP
jgi:hypothetical protein